MTDVDITPRFGAELKVFPNTLHPIPVMLTQLTGWIQTCQCLGKLLIATITAARSLPRKVGKLTLKKVANGVLWLDEIQQFYRERGAIEKEYSAKLFALAKKYFDRKSKKSSSLSVGDTPSLTPGSLERLG